MEIADKQQRLAQPSVHLPGIMKMGRQNMGAAD